MEEEVCPVAGWEGTPVKVVQMGEVGKDGRGGSEGGWGESSRWRWWERRWG